MGFWTCWVVSFVHLIIGPSSLKSTRLRIPIWWIWYRPCISIYIYMYMYTYTYMYMYMYMYMYVYICVYLCIYIYIQVCVWHRYRHACTRTCILTLHTYIAFLHHIICTALNCIYLIFTLDYTALKTRLHHTEIIFCPSHPKIIIYISIYDVYIFVSISIYKLYYCIIDPEIFDTYIFTKDVMQKHQAPRWWGMPVTWIARRRNPWGVHGDLLGYTWDITGIQLGYNWPTMLNSEVLFWWFFYCLWTGKQKCWTGNSSN